MARHASKSAGDMFAISTPASVHKSLISLIREHASGELVAGVMAECIQLADEIEPGLAAFYNAIIARQEDFTNMIDSAA